MQAVAPFRGEGRVGPAEPQEVGVQEVDGRVPLALAEAPEIDGVVRVSGRGASALPVGEFADVMVTGASDYDLEARLA